MSKYDELARLAQNASAEEKLQIIRHEMLNPLTLIRGHAELICLTVNRGKTEDLEEWSNTIIEATDDLRTILDIVTNVPKSED